MTLVGLALFGLTIGEILRNTFLANPLVVSGVPSSIVHQIDGTAFLDGNLDHLRLVGHLLLVVVNLQLVADFDGEARSAGGCGAGGDHGSNWFSLWR